MSLRRTTHPFDLGVKSNAPRDEDVPVSHHAKWRQIDDSIIIDTPPVPSSWLQRMQCREHPRKYTVCAILVQVFVILGVLVGIAYIKLPGKVILSLQQRLVASAATNVATVSILPAKSGDAAGRRRRRRRQRQRRRELRVGDALEGEEKEEREEGWGQKKEEKERNLGATDDDDGLMSPSSASDDAQGLLSQMRIALPASFASTCDYNLAGNPQSAVQDPAAASAATVTKMSCQFAQLRISDVGINSTFNPSGLPYVALVDEGLCGGRGLTTYYVSSSGPAQFGGDGDYLSNIHYVNPDGQEVHATLANTVSGGSLASSKLVFDQAYDDINGGQRGCLLIKTGVKDRTDVQLVLQSTLPPALGGATQESFLHTIFNTKTFVGGASSNFFAPSLDAKGNTVYTKSTYGLDFVSDAIRHRTTTAGAPPKTKCIDFRSSSRILVSDKYTLFNALSGAKRSVQSGYPIEASFPQYTQPVSAYATLSGVLSDQGVLADGTTEDTSLLFASPSLPVQRPDYNDPENPQKLTLQVAPGQLVRVKRRHFLLSDIVGLVMTVTNTPSTYPIEIMWDGSQLVQVGDTLLGCYSAGMGSFVATNATPSAPTDCQCLTPREGIYYPRLFSAFNQSLALAPQGMVKVDPPVPFVPSAADYPRGLDVTAGEIKGHIDLQVPLVQTLSGILPAPYAIGGIVFQNRSREAQSRGLGSSAVVANGTIIDILPKRIMGLDSTFTLLAGLSNSSTCAVGQSTKNVTLNVLPAGAMISQKLFSYMCTAAMNSTRLTSFPTIAITSTPIGTTTPVTSNVPINIKDYVKVGMMVTGDGIPAYTFVTNTTRRSVTLSNRPVGLKTAAATRSFWSVGYVRREWRGKSGLHFEYIERPRPAVNDPAVMASVTAVDTGASFIITEPIPPFEVSLPMDSDSIPSLANFTFLSGSIQWDSNTGLSTDPADVVIDTDGLNCCSGGSPGCASPHWVWESDGQNIPKYFLTDNVTVKAVSPSSIQGVSARMALQAWVPTQGMSPITSGVRRAFVTHGGSKCIGEPGKSTGVFTATIPNTYCVGLFPKFFLKCNHRIETYGNTIKVQVNPGSPPFKALSSVDGPYPLKQQDLILVTVGLGGDYPEWITSSSGESLPVTGASRLTYTTESIVMPDEPNAGPLLCSGGRGSCPLAATLSLPTANMSLTAGSDWAQLDAQANFYMHDNGQLPFMSGMVVAGAGLSPGTSILACYLETGSPTGQPSTQPTIKAGNPTKGPTGQPSSSPTSQPSSSPTSLPSVSPQSMPTSVPTKKRKPTRAPTLSPTDAKARTVRPTLRWPTGQPSGSPTSMPTNPTGQPTRVPTSPTGRPTGMPTNPTGQPTATPSIPTGQPSGSPSTSPTGQPSSTPTLSNSTSQYITGMCRLSKKAFATGTTVVEGSWGTLTQPTIDSHTLTAPQPSHLSPDVHLISGGECIASTNYNLSVSYAGVLGPDPSDNSSMPFINLVWVPAYVDTGKVRWYSVKFMQMRDRGRACDPDMPPTVTWSAPEPWAKISAVYNQRTFTVLAIYRGALAEGMPIRDDGGIFGSSYETGTARIVSCSRYTDANNPPGVLTSPITCIFNGLVQTYGTKTANLRGTVCKTMPAATVGCQVGSDVSDFRQGVSYAFDSRAGLLTQVDAADPSSGGPVALYSGHFGGDDGSGSLLADASAQRTYGPFFADTPANTDLLTCPYDSQEACDYLVFSALSEYFYYSTGPAAQRVSLFDASGAAVPFDQPMPMVYTHHGTKSNSGRSYDGVTMLLTYNGPGDLVGLPTMCLDEDNRVADCVDDGSGQTTKYVDINIPPDAPLKDLSGEHYYARAKRSVELYPKADDDSMCSNLNFSRVPAASDFATLYTPPLRLSEALPAKADLQDGYLNKGQAAVVAGSTLYELQDMERS